MPVAKTVAKKRARRSLPSPRRDEEAPRPLPPKHARGREAEAVAEGWLVERGFRVLWKNLRIGPLEIDLVAAKGDLAVIVEVRTRGLGSFEGPLASITRTKRLALLRAARGVWRGRLSKMAEIARVRIDVAAVTLGDGAPRVEWIPGAFTADDV